MIYQNRLQTFRDMSSYRQTQRTFLVKQLHPLKHLKTRYPCYKKNIFIVQCAQLYKIHLSSVPRSQPIP